MRRVTVIALRRRVMGRFLPGFVVLLHHVTVRTRRRLVRQVRVSAGVNKGVKAQAECNPNQPSRDRGQCYSRSHCLNSEPATSAKPLLGCMRQMSHQDGGEIVADLPEICRTQMSYGKFSRRCRWTFLCG